MKNRTRTLPVLLLLALLALPALAAAQSTERRSYPDAAGGGIMHATPATSPQARVRQAEQWLQSLKTGQARFTQRGYDGTVLTGTFYISRPGRLRFEYDPPVQDFVVADGVLIHFYDSQQNQTSSAPIGTTLADFLLRKSARLSGDVTVQSVAERNGIVSIRMVQTANPAAGTLTVDFNADPFMLRSWTILDPQGLTTQVALTGLRLGMPLPPQYFVYKDPSGRTRLND